MSGEQPVVDDAGRELDRIRLTGITATGWHGLLPEERRAGQQFLADVVVHLDTRRAAARDDLTHSVDYGLLAQEVHAVLAGEPVDLIETVAERIAATVLAHPGVQAVDVAVHKPQAPITVPFADVVVQIRRDRHKLPAAEPYRADRGEPAPSAVSEATRAAAHAVHPRTAQLPLAEVPTAGGLPGPSSAPAAPSTPLAVPTFAEVMGPDVAALAAAVPAAATPGPVVGAGVGAVVDGVADGAPSTGAPAVAVAPPDAASAASAVSPSASPSAPQTPGPTADDVSETTVLPRTSADAPALGPDGPARGDVLDLRPAQPVDVVLALGSNLGPSQETLREVVAELHQLPGLEVVAVSPLARTAPVGGPEQPDYLDAVVLARTSLAPRGLLHALQLLENRHGRERHERWGPRTLDLDIVVYGSVTAVTDDLELPHPRAHQRAFVLQPWAQVDPAAVLPGLGGGPVAQLAATAPDRDGVRWMALDWLTAPVQHTGSVDVSVHGGPAPAPSPAPSPAPPGASLFPPRVEPAAPAHPAPAHPAPAYPASTYPAPAQPAPERPAPTADEADQQPGPAWPWGP